MATGLLIVCVGKGTKAVDAFMAMTKEVRGAPSCLLCCCQALPAANRTPRLPTAFLRVLLWPLCETKPHALLTGSLLHSVTRPLVLLQYSGTLRLGEGTPSLDAETPVEERLPWEHITGAAPAVGLKGGPVRSINAKAASSARVCSSTGCTLRAS